MSQDNRMLLDKAIWWRSTADMMPTLECLFGIADAGQWPLKSAKALDKDKVAVAVSELMGRENIEIVCISAAKPFRCPEWMKESTYRSLLVQEFGKGFGANVFSEYSSPYLRRRNDDEFSKRCTITDSLDEFLLNGLQEMIDARVSPPRRVVAEWEDHLSRLCHDTLENCVHIYARFSIFRQSDLADRFVPIINILPDCVPLCWTYDDVVVVLTA